MSPVHLLYFSIWGNFYNILILEVMPENLSRESQEVKNLLPGREKD